MQSEYVEKAKSGDLKAFKVLLNQSLGSQGISVRSIDINSGVISIQLRSAKGKIENTILDKVRLNTEKLGIDTVESVRVYQYQGNTSFDPITRNKFPNSLQDGNEFSSKKFPFNFINKVYENDLILKNFGIVLFFLGFIMMGIGLIYDPLNGDTYNIGEISFKETYTNTGGFVAICGSIFIVSSRGKLDR